MQKREVNIVGEPVNPKNYKIDGQVLTIYDRVELNPSRWEPGTCPACMKKDVVFLRWNGEMLVCPDCGFTDDAHRWEEISPPILKEESILFLGWKHAPDTKDYLWTSYIFETEDTWYELSNEDKDDVWFVQECRADGSYVQEGDNMFFILKREKDLKDLMRLMDLK